MASCPNCGKKPRHILAQTGATQEIAATTEDVDWQVDTERIIYTCSECGERVGVNSFDDAVNFVKGGETDGCSRSGGFEESKRDGKGGS